MMDVALSVDTITLRLVNDHVTDVLNTGVHTIRSRRAVFENSGGKRYIRVRKQMDNEYTNEYNNVSVIQYNAGTTCQCQWKSRPGIMVSDLAWPWDVERWQLLALRLALHTQHVC